MNLNIPFSNLNAQLLYTTEVVTWYKNIRPCLGRYLFVSVQLRILFSSFLLIEQNSGKQ